MHLFLVLFAIFIKYFRPFFKLLSLTCWSKIVVFTNKKKLPYFLCKNERISSMFDLCGPKNKNEQQNLGYQESFFSQPWQRKTIKKFEIQIISWLPWRLCQKHDICTQSATNDQQKLMVRKSNTEAVKCLWLSSWLTIQNY